MAFRKTIDRRFIPGLTLAMTLWAAGCIESTEPSASPVSVIQVPGCIGGAPAIEAAGRVAADTCFDYRFGETLIVEFCARANCCPDSNRFSVRHRISSDTIYVTLADTAAPLCRCACSYRLVMAFEDLPGRSYLFFCTREDYSSQYVSYSRRVYRNP